MKPQVFKNEGKWYSARATFGFQSRIECTEHASWVEAVKEARRANKDNGSGHTTLERAENWDREIHSAGWGWTQ